MSRGLTSKIVKALKEIASYYKTIIIILTPIIMLPLPICVPDKASKCAYAVIIMGVYWMTEAMPMAVTALLPMMLMPLLGVLSAKKIATNYLKDTNMLFVGGLIVAVAVEKCNLHKRIALRVLMLVGSSPRWLMLGFMTTTAFLSMWISNTATTAMMVPIAEAVLQELEQTMDKHEKAKADVYEMETLSSPRKESERGNISPQDAKAAEAKEDAADPVFTHMAKGVVLCIAYAANIGGTATLTGTAPNLVLSGQMETIFGSNTGINFSSWFIYAFPNMVITLLFAWGLLQLMFLGWRTLLGPCVKGGLHGSKAADDIIKAEYEDLGKISFAEVSVLIYFIILALLWLTRKPEFVDGWSVLFNEGYVTDGAVAISISILLFISPARRPNFLCCRSKDDDSEPGPSPALLDWETVQSHLPWNVVILLGGGFALADSCKESGLSVWIGEQMVGMKDFPAAASVFLLCVLLTMFTEITSNTATATIFLPILGSLAQNIGVNPLFFMVPVTVCTSFAFMLPVATPPNAIVFAHGRLKIIDMMKCGIFMNMMCVVIVTFSINTWGAAHFKLHTFPEWARLPGEKSNATLIAKILTGVNATEASILP